MENAVRHGISKKAAGGCIEILGGKVKNALVLSVRDNGIGLQSEKKGIGLNNTMERLRTLYADNHEFSIRNLESGGVQIDIRLPYQIMVGQLIK